MKKTLFIMLASAWLLSGCGLKGPLYMPDESGKTQSVNSTQIKAAALSAVLPAHGQGEGV